MAGIHIEYDQAIITYSYIILPIFHPVIQCFFSMVSYNKVLLFNLNFYLNLNGESEAEQISSMSRKSLVS